MPRGCRSVPAPRAPRSDGSALRGGPGLRGAELGAGREPSEPGRGSWEHRRPVEGLGALRKASPGAVIAVILSGLVPLPGQHVQCPTTPLLVLTPALGLSPDLSQRSTTSPCCRGLRSRAAHFQHLVQLVGDQLLLLGL